MVLGFDRLQALRDCCRDDRAFARLQQLLGLLPENPHSQTSAIPAASSPHLLQGIAKATSLLLTSHDYTAVIAQVLQILGEALGVDRVYIFCIHPHPQTQEMASSLRWEWSRDAIAPQIQNPLLQNRVYAAHGLWRWYTLLKSGQTISGTVNNFAPAEQRMLQAQQIRALLVVPIFVDGVLWGSIGFDECHRDRQWTADEESALQLMATSLGGAIARQQAESALRYSQCRLEKITANIPGMIYQFIRQSDGTEKMLYVSSGSRDLLELEPEVIQANCKVLMECCHPDDRQSLLQSLDASAAALQPWNWQGRVVTPAGVTKWVQCVSRPEAEADGSVLWDGVIIDITERKRVEELSRQSEARYRAMLDACPDMMFRLDRNGTYLDFKGNATADIPRDAILGTSLWDWFPPDVADLCYAAIQAALKTGTLQTCEYPMHNSYGLRNFEARLTVSGEDEVLAIVRDISDQKQAEIALRESEEKFSKAFRSSPNPMTIATLAEGRLIEVNDSYVQVLGFSRQESIGKTALDLNLWLSPADREQVVQQLRERGSIANLEFSFRVKSGEIRTGLFSAELIQLGEETCLIDCIIDITERKRAEQQLQQATERDRLLGQIALRIRQSLDLDQILNTTVEEVRQFLNADRVCIGHGAPDNRAMVVAESVAPQWRSLRGWSIENPDHLRELEALFAQGQIQVVDDTRQTSGEYPAIAFYNEAFQVQASLSVPIMLENQFFGLLVAHQCSVPRHWESHEIDLLTQLATQVSIAVQQAKLYEQVRALNAGLERQVQKRTAQLRQKMEELQELNDLKDEFLNAFSHDVKTPIMGISLVLNNLLNQTGDTISVNRSILERMAQSSNNQLQLITSMLEAHSAETKGISLHYELVQLSQLIQSIVEDLDPLFTKDQATLENLVPPDLPLVNADPIQLRRVFENLLTNALNHNPPGVHIRLNATVQEDVIRLTIEDDGMGMPPEMCDRLFQRYVRGPKSRHTGIGLGLYLCRQIITAHGGQIGVTSTPGQGSIFWLTLPLAIPARTSSGPEG
ncbi:MAG TPA: GAF domain-containing protein [Synechococcales cyanobacterium M55_K2018_004]|nr:GAF domain-containing protein [Synechococcales cyanobacterium M55_K2018_004]